MNKKHQIVSYSLRVSIRTKYKVTCFILRTLKFCIEIHIKFRNLKKHIKMRDRQKIKIMIIKLQLLKRCLIDQLPVTGKKQCIGMV